MKAAAVPLAVLAIVVVFPVLIVVVSGGGGSSAAAIGGIGAGLEPNTVPTGYVDLVAAAGQLCAAAPPALIAAQIDQESGWDPTAVSPSGAQGIAQFLPSTWTTWAQPPSASPFDPVAAIPAQGRYDCALAQQMTQWQGQGKLPASFSVTQLMLAGYNSGAKAVLAAGGIPQNGQTPGYVTAIIAGAAKYSDTTGSSASSSFGAAVVAAAESQIGTPYAWDGGTNTGPSLGVCTAGAGANDCHINGYDCSGLVMFAVYQASAGATKLSHSADLQTRSGTPVDQAAMLPGDLISFTDPGATTAHHIGIYIGNQQIVDAPESGTQVRIDSLTTPYYQGQQWRVVRYG